MEQIVLTQEEIDIICQYIEKEQNSIRLRIILQGFISNLYKIELSEANLTDFVQGFEQNGRMCAVITDGKIYWIPCDKIKTNEI